MSDFIVLMFPPLVACFVLVGIHAYFGLHVVRRGVIFVDLALAQVSALGATAAFLFGYSLHSTPSYISSLLLTAVVAVLLSFLRKLEGDVPQEAFIGIIYAVSASAAILVLSLTPEGGEELKSLLVGHLLFIRWHEIVWILGVYSLVGGLHWLARKPLLAVSEGRVSEAVSTTWWDFFFYLTFGVVVTSSVEVAGVLLVFAMLVAPAVCSVILARKFASQLIIGWGIGAVTSLIGIIASYYFDLPTGATVVCCFVPAILLTLLFSKFRPRQAV